MKFLRIVAAALALVSAPALAQSPNVGKNATLPSGSAPGVVIYCDDGTGKTAICASSSGGTGGGDASAANQTSQITAATLTNTRLGDISAPATGSVNQRLGLLNTTLGSPFQTGGSIGNTAFGAQGVVVTGDQSYTVGTSQQLNLTATGRLKVGLSSAGLVDAATQPSTQTTADLVACKNRASNTMSAGQTAALSCDTTGALLTGNAALGTIGGTAPTIASLSGGVGPSGNTRGLAVDTGGRLLPGQGQVTSTRTTLTASTATALEAAGVTTRILESVTTEAALTANVFLCSWQTTSCSATSYDFLLPSGAGAGTTFTPPFATQGRLYAYSTGTPVLVLNSWTAQ